MPLFIDILKQLFGISTEKVIADPMKYLIVGLGNIGAEYENTRHNVGFEVMDLLAEKFEAPFKSEQLGSIARIRYKSRTFILLKPSTYMNRSGKSVRYWLQKEKIKKENLLVVLDDLNLPFGKQRLRGKGSDGGHNGLKDITQFCDGTNYARLRIGIGNEFSKGYQADYVLSEWSDDEKNHLAEIIAKAADTVLAFGTIGLARAMNQFN